MEFKAKVALEVIKGLKTSSELAKGYYVHPTQISQWKYQLQESLPELFRNGKVAPDVAEQAITVPLFQEIGRLKIELDRVKKCCQVPGRVSSCG